MSHATLPRPGRQCVVPRNYLIATLTHYALGLSLPMGRAPFESAPMKERRRHHTHLHTECGVWIRLSTAWRGGRMLRRALHVRLGEDCAQAVTALAQACSQPVSRVLRDAVHDLLTHPERYAELLAARAQTTFGDS